MKKAKVLLKTIKLQFRVAPLIGLYVTATGIVVSVSVFAIEYVTGRIIDVISIGDLHMTKIMSFILIGIIVIKLLLSFSTNILQSYVWDFRLRSIIWKNIYNKITELDFASIEDPKRQNLLRKVMDQSEGGIKQISHGIVRLLTLLIKSVTVIITLWYLHPLICISVIIISLLYGYTGNKMIALEYTAYDRNIVLYRQINMIYRYFLNIENLFDIIVFKYGRLFAQKYTKLRERIFGNNMNNFRKAIVWDYFVQMLLNVSIIIMWWYLINQALYGYISIGMLSFYIMFIYGGFDALSSVVWRYSSIAVNLKYAADYFKFMDLKPIVQSKIPNDKTKSIGGIYSIEAKNVIFTYPHGRKIVLNNLSIKCNKYNKHIAIVGRNGAGKTTLLKLLLGVYLPNKGNVLINDIAIDNMDLNNYRKHISFLPQNFNKFDVLTLQENILMGRKYDKNLFNKIVQICDIEELIDALPRKDKTVLSSSLKDGVDLSTGQWQKIAMARALYSNGDILMMDEPTANIDPMSAFNIMQKVLKLYEDRLLIIVSHRYSIVRNSDHIYVMDSGKIIEEGNFDQLVNKKGFFYKGVQKEKRLLQI